MTIANTLIILATFLGPIVAVRLTRYLDERKEKRERKLMVFKTLMATRAYTISQAHVEALNRIDLEFSKDDKAEKKVVAVWKQYLDLLGNKSLSPEQWAIKRIDLLVDLLQSMGQALGYDLDKTDIKNASYSPVAHGRFEEEHEAIRRGILELLEGKRAIPMLVTNFPPPIANTSSSESGKDKSEQQP